MNNAGVATGAPFLELTPRQFQQIVETNLHGAFYTAQAVARELIAQGQSGTILNISSIAAKRVYLLGLTPYNVSKAGVSMLTRCMAAELASHRIRVNELCPGLVETDLNRLSLQDPQRREARRSLIPLGRIGQPQDLVEAAVYLCSDKAKWVTGASFTIDGGMTLIR